MEALDIRQYLPLRFSRNPLTYVLDAAPASIVNRSQLDYCLTVLIPKGYLSGEYVELITLHGREYPKRVETGVESYPGAAFDIGVYLDDRLKRTPPRPNQTAPELCGQLTMPYFVKGCIYNEDELLEDTMLTMSQEVVLKGQLGTEQFPGWNSQFFTKHLAESRRFLTWQPDEKWVERDQPEFLYFLTNFSPCPATLYLRYELQLANSVFPYPFSSTISNIQPNAVYGLPVGFQGLNLNNAENVVGDTIVSYRVYVSAYDEDNDEYRRISEVRTYYVNRDYARNLCYLIFANSLGGYDTLRCTGQTGRLLAVKGTPVQRVLEPNYLPSSAELFSLNRTGEKTLTVNTGLTDGGNLDYLAELAISEEVYVVTQEGFVRLVPADTTLPLQSDDEYLAGRTFTFKLAKAEVGYSDLPAPPTTPARPTRWVPVNPYCSVNDRGIRTGYLLAGQLELRYVDDGNLVKPRQTKLNLPGTEGYVPPAVSGVCSTTPFTNSLIEQPGTFRRTNCPVDQEGAVATLTIAAGTYGAETADSLSARVQQALKNLDTQEYANLYGACQMNPANYTWSVPDDHFHVRFNQPNRMSIYYEGSPAMGNAWNVQGQGGAYVFGLNTNDINLPSDYDTYAWRVFVYGTVNEPFRFRAYINGGLVLDETRVFNVDEFELFLPFGGNSVTDSRVYLQLTDG